MGPSSPRALDPLRGGGWTGAKPVALLALAVRQAFRRQTQPGRDALHPPGWACGVSSSVLALSSKINTERPRVAARA